MSSSFSSVGKLRAQIDEELRTQFVCPANLANHRMLFAGSQHLLQLDGPSPEKAQQLHEIEACLSNPGWCGRKVATAEQWEEAQLHALLVSNSQRTPGFGYVCSTLHNICQDEDGEPTVMLDGPPLVRLLRRVASWYYYRVMFDPLEDLLALNSTCELLFQLLTPHQQLSCMADILMVLSCPALAEHSDTLDTPLHTATLLSMLKMAQHLAVAEAALQQHEEQVQAVLPQAMASQEHSNPHEDLHWRPFFDRHLEGAIFALHTLVTPQAAVLQLCRQQSIVSAGLPPPKRLGLWPEHSSVNELFQDHFAGLVTAAQQQQQADEASVAMVGFLEGQVAEDLQRSDACKAVGALLSQLCQLPEKQLQLWWHAQEPEQQAGSRPTHAAAVAQWLRQCCTALKAGDPPQLDLKTGQDPVMTLLLWITQVLSPGRHKQTQQQQQQRQQQAPGPRQQETPDPLLQQQQHPAQALMQLLDILLSALQFRHGLSMQEWQTSHEAAQSQSLLLAALHSHCMQLLARTQQLPAAACSFGQGCGSARNISSNHSSTSSSLSQQHIKSWKRCCLQLQHDLLMVVQLLKHLQHHNAIAGLQDLLHTVFGKPFHSSADFQVIESIIAASAGSDRATGKAAAESYRRAVNQATVAALHGTLHHLSQQRGFALPGSAGLADALLQTAASLIKSDCPSLWADSDAESQALRGIMSEDAPEHTSDAQVDNAKLTAGPQASLPKSLPPQLSTQEAPTGDNEACAGSGAVNSSGSSSSSSVSLDRTHCSALHSGAANSSTELPAVDAEGAAPSAEVAADTAAPCFVTGSSSSSCAAKVQPGAAPQGLAMWLSFPMAGVSRSRRRPSGAAAVPASSGATPLSSGSEADAPLGSCNGAGTSTGSQQPKLEGTAGALGAAGMPAGVMSPQPFRDDAVRPSAPAMSETASSSSSTTTSSSFNADTQQPAVGLQGRLSSLQDHWKQRLEHPKQTQAQQRQEQLQQGLGQPAASHKQVASLAMMPDTAQQHFSGMRPDTAASWIALLRLAASDAWGGSKIRQPLLSVFDRLCDLKLVTWPAQLGPKVLDCLLQQEDELALLTALLCEDHCGLLHTEAQHQGWQEARDVLIKVLRSAVEWVCDGFETHGQSLLCIHQMSVQRVVDDYGEVFALVDAAPKPAPIIDTDLSGLRDAIRGWAQRVRVRLTGLVPMEVRYDVQHSVFDQEEEWIRIGDRSGIKRFADEFPKAIQGLHSLVRVDAFLSEVGRHLQAEVKLLQRLNRVLLSAPADSILAGMHQHFVQAVHKQGLSALGEVAASHKDIRAAFEGQLARDGMGVIQHALSLHQALERKQDDPGYQAPRQQLAHHLQLVLAAMCTYAFNSSPALPSLALPESVVAQVLGRRLADTAQQMIGIFAHMEPPISRFWFLLAGHEAEAGFLATLRAVGDIQLYLGSAFQSSPSCSASSSHHAKQIDAAADTVAGSGSGSTGGEQVVGPGTSGSSSSRQPEQSAEQKLNHPAFYQGRQVAPCPWVYCSSDDEGMTSDAVLTACMARHDASQLLSLQATARRRHQQLLHLAAGNTQQQGSNLHKPELQEPDLQLAQLATTSEQLQEHLSEQLAQRKLTAASCQQACRLAMRESPESSSWQDSCMHFVSRVPGGSSSSETHSSSTDEDDDGESYHGDATAHRDTGLTAPTTCSAASSAAVSKRCRASLLPGCMTAAQEQRQQERKQRQHMRFACAYDWGGTLPDVPLRAQTLRQQQLVLNRVAELQDAADAALAKLKALEQLASEAADSSSTRSSTAQPAPLSQDTATGVFSTQGARNRHASCSAAGQEEVAAAFSAGSAAPPAVPGSPADATSSACSAAHPSGTAHTAAAASACSGAGPAADGDCAASSVVDLPAERILRLSAKAPHLQFGTKDSLDLHLQHVFHFGEEQLEKTKPADPLLLLQHLRVQSEPVASSLSGVALEDKAAVQQLGTQLNQMLTAESNRKTLFSPTSAGLLELLTFCRFQALAEDAAQQQAPDDAGSAWQWSEEKELLVNDTRQLLWQVLRQLKPAACEWYEHGAKHYHQQKQQKQQQQKRKQAGGKASSTSAAGTDAPVPVAECSSPLLWQVLCHSLVSDLLLVPPSLRDMVENDWAAGAGRLEPALAADSSSGDSNAAAAAAARMLLLQYARAARRQYEQDYKPSDLLCNLLMLQLMADEEDTLLELQPDSMAAVRAALSLQTGGAVAGMEPVLAIAHVVRSKIVPAGCSENGGNADSTTGTAGASSSRGSSSGSSNSSDGSGASSPSSSANTESSSSSGGSGGLNSSSSGQGSVDPTDSQASQQESCTPTESPAGCETHQCCCCCNCGDTGLSGRLHRPNLLQMAAQLGCYQGSPSRTLPWLQLLSRYHALSWGVYGWHGWDFEDRSSRLWTPLARMQHAGGSTAAAAAAAGAPLDPCVEPQGQLAAMAVALQSFGMPLPHLPLQLARGVQQRYANHLNIPVLGAPLHSPMTPLLQQMWTADDDPISSSSSSSHHHPMAQQQGRQHKQQTAGLQQQKTQKNKQQQEGQPAGAPKLVVDGDESDDDESDDKEVLGGSMHSDLLACSHWLHADTLMRVQPGQWQQHLQATALRRSSTNTSSGGRGGDGGGSTAAAAAAQPDGIGGTSSSSSSSRRSSQRQQQQAAARQAALQDEFEARQVKLVSDLACDWCCGPLQQQQQRHKAASNAAQSKGGQRQQQKQQPTSGSGSSSSSSASKPPRADDRGVFGCPSCNAAQYCSQACADAAKKVHQANCWRLQALAADGLCWQQRAYQQSASSTCPRSFWDLRKSVNA